MPTYEYACRNCGNRFEIVQSMFDEPLTICDQCGGELRKIFTPPAIAFRGSGFYATDSRRRASDREGAAKPEKEGEKAKEKKTTEDAKPKTSEKEGGGAGSKPAPAPAKDAKGKTAS
jgi:putative FmdB family regulatory protein